MSVSGRSLDIRTITELRDTIRCLTAGETQVGAPQHEIPLCGAHAQSWFTERNWLHSEDCVVCAHALARAEVGAQPPADRSDKDYAIEHAGYLADAAQNYLDAINVYQQMDERGEEYDPSEFTDYRSALVSAVYEFRKRAKRASSPAVGFVSDQTHPGPSCEVCGAAMQFKCPSCGSSPAPSTQVPVGPIACRDLGCDGSCGLKSVYFYGDTAADEEPPSESAARTFATKKGLNPDIVAKCNAGAPTGEGAQNEISTPTDPSVIRSSELFAHIGDAAPEITVPSGGAPEREEILSGLHYIADSPPHEHGGFHPQTVEIAKRAIALIRDAASSNAPLNEQLQILAQNCADHANQAGKFALEILGLKGELREARKSLNEADELLKRADESEVSMKFSNAVSCWRARVERLRAGERG